VTKRYPRGRLTQLALAATLVAIVVLVLPSGANGACDRLLCHRSAHSSHPTADHISIAGFSRPQAT
jgi:hypothetical protein